MREEVSFQPPAVGRSNTGFCLRKTDEASFSISRKSIAAEMAYTKRSSHGVVIRRDLKAEDRVNTSAFVLPEVTDTEVLRGDEHSTVPPLGLEKHERMNAEVFFHQAGRDPLQGASLLQWGSLKRSRCSRGPNNQPKACDLAEEDCQTRRVQPVRDPSVILHSSPVDLEESLNAKNGTRRKRDCPYSTPVIATEIAGLEEALNRENRLQRLETTEGKRGSSLQGREYLPVTRSSLGKRVAPPNKFLAALTDESKASQGMKDFSLPKFALSLSRREMEEDFLLIKGSKLPKRPRRRPRVAEKAVFYCTPGIWLTDVSHNRYIVKEKKCVKEKPRGLKAMQSLDSDSE